MRRQASFALVVTPSALRSGAMDDHEMGERSAAIDGLEAIMRGEPMEWEPIDAEGNVIGPAEVWPTPADDQEQRRRQADLN